MRSISIRLNVVAGYCCCSHRLTDRNVIRTTVRVPTFVMGVLCVRVWTLILPLFHPLHTRSALAYLVLAYALQLKQD